VIDEDLGDVVVSLACSAVQWRVEVGRDDIGRGATFQQQFHAVNVTLTSGNVQRRLQLLQHARHSSASNQVRVLS